MLIDIINIKIRLAVLFFIGTAALPGCRAPVVEVRIDAGGGDDNYDPDTDTTFDTGTDTDIDTDSDAGTDGGSDTDTVSKTCPDGAYGIFDNDHSPYYGGDESVDVEVVVFANFGCGHCAGFAREARELWARRPDYMKRVRFFFHHFPYWTEEYISQSTWEGHEATVAAQKQGMKHFWSMHDAVFDSSSSFSDMEDYVVYARDTLKLDDAKFRADFNSDETVSFLKWDQKQGATNGVEGTPTVFVCGEQIFDRSELEEIIDEYI